MTNHTTQVTVAGAGTMGNGIAHSFAISGFSVQLFDTSADALKNAIHTISNNMDRQVAKEILTAEEKQEAFNRITTETNISFATKNADIIIEAITEKKEIKTEFFKNVDSLIKEGCILATNTSSISITELASFTTKPDKVIGMHFMNPVPVMPLVEVVTGLSTSQETLDEIKALCGLLNKTAVTANDYPGFISNRILMPMINEAICALHEGVSGVKEIDTIMELGMAHKMGPLKLADFIGLDVCLSILLVLQDGLGSNKYAPCPLLKKMVAGGQLGVKTGKGFYDWTTDNKKPGVSSLFL